MHFVDVWKWLGNNSAEIIAICALIFTAYQAYLLRKHNRLSVTPKLAVFTARNSENKIGTINIELSNNGLGPAIIKKYEFEVDDKVKTFKDSDEALKFIEKLVGVIGVENKITLILPGHIIAAGESSTMLHLKFSEESNGWEHIEGIIDRLSLRVKYTSMYGEQFEYHSIETHS